MLKKGIHKDPLHGKLKSYVKGENDDEVRKAIFTRYDEGGHLREQDTADVNGFGFIDGRRFCNR
jgi:hypothetical protein